MTQKGRSWTVESFIDYFHFYSSIICFHTFSLTGQGVTAEFIWWETKVQPLQLEKYWLVLQYNEESFLKNYP